VKSWFDGGVIADNQEVSSFLVFYLVLSFEFSVGQRNKFCVGLRIAATIQ
jgi:hypothetical protein